MYPSSITTKNILKTDPGVIKDTPVLIGEYQVQAGEIVRLGYGNGGQASALGRIYAAINDSTPEKIDGTLRIIVASAQDIPLAVVYEARTEDLVSGATDVTKRQAFNEALINAQVKEDKKIQLWFIADATTTISTSDSTFQMSVSRQLT